jgi:hypothetical protein
MATQLSTASGPSRECGIDSVAQVYESGDELVVLVRLNDGLLELRVPHHAAAKSRPPERHIPGFNPEATPC